MRLGSFEAPFSFGLLVIADPAITDSHGDWDPYPHYGWIPANHLKPGMHLKTPDGQSAVVVGGSVPAVHDGWMWDLTVPGNNDHDFYVIAGNSGQSKNGDHAYYGLAEVTAVLVHNSGGMNGCSDAAYQGVLHIKDEVAKGNMSHDLGMSDNELADYLDTYANSGTGQPLKGGGEGWYDSSRGTMVIQQGKYSMTAFKTSYQNFLSRLDPSR